MKLRMFAIAAVAVSALSACVTEEGYRQHMEMEIGRSSDDILMKFGAPQNRTQMADGAEMWTYNKTTVENRPAYYRDETRTVTRTFKDKDGKEKTETITETYPVLQPAQTFRSFCTTRFVMGGGRVQSFSFDGDGCVAEEIQK